MEEVNFSKNQYLIGLQSEKHYCPGIHLFVGYQPEETAKLLAESSAYKKEARIEYPYETINEDYNDVAKCNEYVTSLFNKFEKSGKIIFVVLPWHKPNFLYKALYAKADSISKCKELNDNSIQVECIESRKKKFPTWKYQLESLHVICGYRVVQ